MARSRGGGPILVRLDWLWQESSLMSIPYCWVVLKMSNGKHHRYMQLNVSDWGLELPQQNPLCERRTVFNSIKQVEEGQVNGLITKARVWCTSSVHVEYQGSQIDCGMKTQRAALGRQRWKNFRKPFQPLRVKYTVSRPVSLSEGGDQVASNISPS